MKKILAIIGSPHKGETFRAVQAFEQKLKSLEDVNFETIFRGDYHLETCRGCFLCFFKGEQFCPQKDDRDILVEKMRTADGVVFATPNYSLQVTAMMKNFFDRFAFVFHRPRFFYKTSTAIVVQAVYGGDDIVKYLGTVAEFWEFKNVKGVVLQTPGDRLPTEQVKIDLKLESLAEKFHKSLNGPREYRPKLKQLAIFHAARTSHKVASERFSADYNYFKDHGWLESDYYCEANLNPAKKMIGRTIDWFITGQMEKAKKERAALTWNSAASQT
jgi:multimeric flavodoxin WrbA